MRNLENGEFCDENKSAPIMPEKKELDKQIETF